MTGPTLWAVHVEGPDDLLAMPDKATADDKAERINAVAEQIRRRDASPLNPIVSASVVPWPGTADEHADEVARLAVDGGYAP